VVSVAWTGDFAAGPGRRGDGERTRKLDELSAGEVGRLAAARGDQSRRAAARLGHRRPELGVHHQVEHEVEGDPSIP